MSNLLPLLLNELLDEYRSPSLYDQHFGLGLLNNELTRPSSHTVLLAPLKSGYVRPWRMTAAGDSGVSNVRFDTEGFKVSLDVQQFKPEELKVKVVDDFLVVEGNHEERQDEHGFVSRQFTRRYKLPSDVDLSAIASKLSSDGVLTLHAPKKPSLESGEREIPITHTNEPALKQADKKQKLEKMEDN